MRPLGAAVGSATFFSTTAPSGSFACAGRAWLRVEPVPRYAAVERPMGYSLDRPGWLSAEV